MTDQGRRSEDLIQALCERMFFRDFVVRDLRFIKSGGAQKEAADVLVLDDRTFLVFQVKAREVTDPGSDVGIKRLESSIDEAIGQLKTFARAIDAGQLTHVENLRGVKIPIPTAPRPSTVGVVVLDIVNEEQLPEDHRPSVMNGLGFMRDVPAHIFLRSTFELLVEELDTLPDFLDYLACRRSLIEKGLLAPLTEELDLLVVFKTQRDSIDAVLRGEYNMLFVAPDQWDSFIRDEAGHRARRATLNEDSYLIDGLLDALHTSLTQPHPEDGHIQASPDGYFTILSELGRLSRVERRVLGMKMREKLEAARTKVFSLGIMGDVKANKAILFMATSKPRQQRIAALQNLSLAAAHRTGVTRILGIATEPAGVPHRSFDAVLQDNLTFTEEEEAKLRELADTVFGPIRQLTSHEWE